MIGGKAPSQYLDQIQSHAQVLLNIPGMDAILKSHAIDPALLRADSFEAFYAARRAALLALIERAMGKTPTAAGPVLADDDDADDEDDEASVEVG